jgi:hypothetical protein
MTMPGSEAAECIGRASGADSMHVSGLTII